MVAGSISVRRFMASSKVSGCNETGLAFGIFPPQKASGIARLYRSYTCWACGSAENVARVAFSASCHHVPEYIRVLAVIVILATDEGFINFDFAHELGKATVPHSRPNPVAHIPSRPVVAAADLPVNLKGTNSLLALGHQVNDLEPSPQRVVGVFEYRFGDNRKTIAVFSAAILVLAHPMKRAGLKLVYLCTIATWALCAARPSKIAQILFAILFGLKSRRELGQRHRGLCCFHGVESNTT